MTGAAHWLDVVNPANEQIIGQVPDCGQQELDAAVAAARGAFPAWSRTPIADRRAVLTGISNVIKDHKDELMRLLTSEQGKPHAQAAAEISAAATNVAALATLDLEDEITEDSPVRLSRTRRVPVGVVGAIVQWNFPVAMAVAKITPALLSG